MSRRLEERQAREWRRGRKLRVRERHKYTEEDDDDSDSLDVEETRAFDLDEKLTAERFEPSQQETLLVHEMTGSDITLKYFQQTGFKYPIVVKKPQGLGMKMPDKDFSVEDVKQCVGSRRVIDVMDTVNQKDENMTMKEWVKYFESEGRDRILNVISLEFSHTKLETHVESPSIVKQMDWVDLVWPKHLKESQTEGTNKIEDMKYPKVQKYCLMSVKGCYTDFHIDFGGTSVWYHIIKGEKVFWLIPPTEKNIKRYEEWVLSGKQSDVFFGDTADECQRITLEAGFTFFIPSGWIHAVYTPQDSIVFGGNFLHSWAVQSQLQVAQLEYTTKVPVKFRYPFFTEMLWYVLQRYVHCLEGRNHLKVNEDGSPKKETDGVLDPLKVGDGILPKVYLTQFEVKGLEAIINWLEKLPKHKKYIPDLIVDPKLLLEDAKRLIKKHENDDPGLAATGVQVLYWGKRKGLLASPNPNIPQTNGPTMLSSSQVQNAPNNCVGTPNGQASSLSITAQLRQIKNHFPFRHQNDQNKPERRPESPPTRPISSNQYTVSSKPFQGPIPSSFAGLIAATAADKSLTNQPLNFGVPITLASQFNPNQPIVKQEVHHVGLINSEQNFQRFHNGGYHGFTIQTHLPPEEPRKNSLNEIVHLTKSVSCETQTPNEFEMSSTSSAPSNNNPQNNSPQKHQDMCTNTDAEYKVKGPLALLNLVNKPMPNVPASGTGSATAAISNDSARRRRTRCKKCEACCRSDCSECHFCKDMKKFGGPGRMKQSCIARQCMAPVLPHTACCIICGRDGWEKLTPVTPGDEAQSTLMECTLCWEILHPICLLEKDPSLKKYPSKMNTDLPNSWECPKCIAQNQAINNNGIFNGHNPANKNKPLKIKKEIGTDTEPSPIESNMDPFRKLSHPSITKLSSHDSSEDELVIKSDEESSCSSSFIINSQSKGPTSNSTTPNSLTSHSPNPITHVRSCSLARFPLLSQGLQQLGKAQSKPSSPSVTTPTTPLISSSSVPKKDSSSSEPISKPHKSKKSVDIKARLFNKMKTLKKLGTDGSRLQNRSTQFQVIKQAALKFNQHKIRSSGGSTSGGSCGDANSSGLPSPVVMKAEKDEFTDDRAEQFEQIKDSSIPKSSDDDEDDEETEEELEENYDFSEQINKRTDTEVTSDSMPPLKKPKFVVRPAPLPEDLSSDTEVEEDEDEDNSDDESKEEEDDEDEGKLKRQRIINHHLKRFKKKRESNLALERDVMINVLPYLSRNDVVRCSLVCRNWNRYCMDPKFWKKIDVSNKRISTWLLRGLVIRQPLDLDISWTRINFPQLSWLIARLPLTERLSLSGLDADVVKGIITCNCPFLTYLNLDWVSGISDNFMRSLLSSPPDSRPGLNETESRLRNLEEIRLAGTDITDATVRLLATNLPNLARLDLSSCRRVTDMGINYLATKKAHNLTQINLSCCTNITSMSLESLKHCTNIQIIDLTKCDQITTDACRRFAASTKGLWMPHPNIILSKQYHSVATYNQHMHLSNSRSYSNFT